jgi:hypothetical protein
MGSDGVAASAVTAAPAAASSMRRRRSGMVEGAIDCGIWV